MSRRILGRVMLVLKVNAGGNQTADLILKVQKTVGIPEGGDGQGCSGMGDRDHTESFLHLALLHKHLDIIGQRYYIPLLCLNLEIFQHNLILLSVALGQSKTISLFMIPAPWSAKLHGPLQPRPYSSPVKTFIYPANRAQGIKLVSEAEKL